MSEWKLSDALAAELLAQLDAASKNAASWEDGRKAGAPMGVGIWEPDAGLSAQETEALRTLLSGGNTQSPAEAAAMQSASHEETAGESGRMSYGWPDGAVSASSDPDMGAVSRFFERDARRYG